MTFLELREVVCRKAILTGACQMVSDVRCLLFPGTVFQNLEQMENTGIL